MGTKILKSMFLVLMVVLLAGFQMSCGSSSTTSDSGGDDSGGDSGGGDSGGGGETGGGVTITTNDEVLANIPDLDPTAVDYSIAAAVADEMAGAVTASANKGHKEYGGSSNIMVKIVQVPGDGLGTFKIYQCRGTTQAGYAEVSYANDAYGLTAYSRMEGANYDIQASMSNLALTNANYTASVDLLADSSSRMVVTANGSSDSNTMQANYLSDTARMVAYWTSTAGCGNGDTTAQGVMGETPFSVSVDASTEAKTYAASDDTALCANLPANISVTSNATLTAAQTWDCTVPSGEAAIDIASAYNLEEAGGAWCQTLSDAWEDASYDPSSCISLPAGVEQIGCLIDKEYAFTVQSIRRVQRMFLCKVRGVFNLADAGTIAGVDVTDGSTIYLNIASVFGD